MNDLKFACRQLLKNPGFTVVAVLTLALGIGLNTAIFSVVNGILLRPLPYREPERLVRVFSNFKERGVDRAVVSAPAFLDWRAQNSVFESMAAHRWGNFNLAGRGEPECIRGLKASASLFPMLGVKPILGRHFTEDEEQFGKHHVVLLSHRLWQRRFGGDPAITGQSLNLNGESYTVVGVMPPEFRYASADAEVWTPIAFTPDELRERGNHSWDVVARLKPGVTLAQAQADMNTIAARLGQQYEHDRGWGVTLVGLQQALVGGSRKALLVLLGTVGFVLLIACANVANLLLARATTRQKEFAVRAALGAGRWHVIRQLLTESALLALAGGTIGWVLALWGVEILTTLGSKGLPRLDEVHLDAAVLAFTLLVSLTTALLFGLAPAWQTSRADMNEALKAGSRGLTEGYRRSRLRHSLVVAETALALVVLVGAGLLMRSFGRLREVDPGFIPSRVLTLSLLLPEQKYRTEGSRAAFVQQVLERVAALPGVASAGAIYGLPFSGGQSMVSVEVEGRPPPQPGEPVWAGYQQVSPRYFRTMGTPLLKGRDFTEHDDTNAVNVVIVNEMFVRQFLGGGEALGKRLRIGDGHTNWTRIIGVVRDARHRTLAEPPQAEMYLPMSQRFWDHVALVVRGATEPSAMASAVRKAVWELDPDQPLYAVRTMEAMMSDSLASRRHPMLLLGLFAAVAVMLAALGIYGVTSYAVSRRTHEIGVRMALGAQRGDVLKLVVGQGMFLALVGVAVGVVAALALTRLLSSLLYQVKATDPMTFVGVAGLLAVVALLASYLPARRATKVDPMVALRYE